MSLIINKVNSLIEWVDTPYRFLKKQPCFQGVKEQQAETASKKRTYLEIALLVVLLVPSILVKNILQIGVRFPLQIGIAIYSCFKKAPQKAVTQEPVIIATTQQETPLTSQDYENQLSVYKEQIADYEKRISDYESETAARVDEIVVSQKFKIGLQLALLSVMGVLCYRTGIIATEIANKISSNCF